MKVEPQENTPTIAFHLILPPRITWWQYELQEQEYTVGCNKTSAAFKVIY
jgi:hypothetical protein